jgi:predicted small lipoprotein YifL
MLSIFRTLSLILVLGALTGCVTTGPVELAAVPVSIACAESTAVLSKDFTIIECKATNHSDDDVHVAVKSVTLMPASTTAHIADRDEAEALFETYQHQDSAALAFVPIGAAATRGGDARGVGVAIFGSALAGALGAGHGADDGDQPSEPGDKYDAKALTKPLQIGPHGVATAYVTVALKHPVDFSSLDICVANQGSTCTEVPVEFSAARKRQRGS